MSSVSDKHGIHVQWDNQYRLGLKKYNSKSKNRRLEQKANKYYIYIFFYYVLQCLNGNMNIAIQFWLIQVSRIVLENLEKRTPSCLGPTTETQLVLLGFFPCWFLGHPITEPQASCLNMAVSLQSIEFPYTYCGFLDLHHQFRRCLLWRRKHLLYFQQLLTAKENARFWEFIAQYPERHVVLCGHSLKVSGR